jgi:sulfane dehydrogenase subunit SoxC
MTASHRVTDASATAGQEHGGETERTIVKPLPPDRLLDLRDGVAHPDDSTGDLALNAETRWEAMAEAGYLTPIDRFFVRNHAPTPRVDPATWRLRVEGPGVERSVEFSYDVLAAMPVSHGVRALECAGNARVFFAEVQRREAPGTSWRLGAIGVARWTGVAMREVLERAGIKAGAREVMLESLDDVRMRRPLPLEKALDEGTLLAYGMNGTSLPPDHGFPVRAIVPGWAAVASVKWLSRLYVSDASSAPLLSPWNTDKYVLTGGDLGAEREPITAQVPKSAIELPWPATLGRGRRTVTGRSWSAGAAIERVEYAVDGDTQWSTAEMFGPNLPGAWARWRFVWEATPGLHEIRVRATDTVGNAQPAEASWNELGYLYGGVVAHPVEVI